MVETKEQDRYEAPEVFELGRAEEVTLGNPNGGWPDSMENFIRPQGP